MTWRRFPDPLTLLVACVLLASALSYVVPAGQYQRQQDPRTGREVVVAGTYQRVAPNPVGPFEAMVAIPRGMTDAADVVFLILFGSAGFTVVDRTGALAAGISWLIRRMGHRQLLVIPLVSLFFAAGGVLENMQEEIIALVPVLTLLTRRLGMTPVTAVAMSIGTAFVGSAFSPINPFQVVIAQQVADVPRLTGWEFRTAFLVAALIVWIAVTTLHASRTRRAHAIEPTLEEALPAQDVRRHAVVLAVVALTFVLLAWGLLLQGWDFNHLTALFFVMGVVAGLIGKLGIGGTARAYTEGFREMALAAILVGVARAIFVVLDDGRVVDSIVHALVAPIVDLPRPLVGMAMMVVHTGVHFGVPSVSGHAVLTMPIMAPMADLLGMSRQVAVLAYQYGAGLTDMITPTNGALMAVLASAGVSYDEWLRFAALWWALLMTLGALALALAFAVGLQ